jgi:5-methylcytosine-specific restriction endonuclease McrA
MGKRQRIWARRAYDNLIQQLGGKCVECGTTEKLTIDHIDGCEFEHTDIEWSHRISIYRREAKEGKLQVLCETHNSKKGDPRDRPDDDGQYDLFTQVVKPNDPEHEPF